MVLQSVARDIAYKFILLRINPSYFRCFRYLFPFAFSGIKYKSQRILCHGNRLRKIVSTGYTSLNIRKWNSVRYSAITCFFFFKYCRIYIFHRLLPLFSIPADFRIESAVPVGSSFDWCLGTVKSQPVIGLCHISWFAPCKTSSHLFFFNNLIISDTFITRAFS